MNLALGISVGTSFRNPREGPLGLDAFWRHSVYCAALTQALGKRMPAGRRPKLGLAYLAGLLHNFGFLLLGHLFKPEFLLLNKLAAAHPMIPVTHLEKRVLGMGNARALMDLGHAEIGAWLMNHWDMPEAVTCAVGRHHEHTYDGPHAEVVHLVMLANQLLKRKGLGDAPRGDLEPRSLARVGIEGAAVEQELESLFEQTTTEELEIFARHLAA